MNTTKRHHHNLLRLLQWLVLGVVCLFSPVAAIGQTVCAVVKIEITQDLTLERQAFDATMRINNGLDTLSIENVNINLSFTDEAGNSILATSDPNNTSARFFVRVDSMSGIDNITGSGAIRPLTTGEIHWLIIPAPGAADNVPSGKLYFVGASLSYTLGGEVQTTTVTPDYIFVKPLPLLQLDYFLTKDVIADDPLTLTIEAPEPYTLGLRVKNNGGAIARNVKIDSAQPRIVENEQGLLVDFQIIGSMVNDQPSTPSLLINLGDVAPNESTVGRWSMISTLSGQFTSFDAVVNHADDLGGQLTSIITNPNTHFLVRDVLVDEPGRDTVHDFLALDGDTLRVYESDSVDTLVTDQSANATLPFASDSGLDKVHTLTAPVTAGFMYVKLPDIYTGTYVIKDVVRSDGKHLSPDNAWISKKKNINTGNFEYSFNLFDSNSTGQYTITFSPAQEQPLPPVLQFIPSRIGVEGQPISFIVQASDPNGDIPVITASNVPPGAVFSDQGNGTASLSWSTGIGQAGAYDITYVATDNTGLTSSRTARITLTSVTDTDGDGLLDSLEIEYFGDLSHDGTGDTDGDGITDAQELQDGTDPTLPPPAVPDDLAAKAGNEQVELRWTSTVDQNNTEAISYAIYWDTQPGVTKDNGNVLTTTTSPFVHTGLTNDETYYYVIAAVGPGGESAVSPEVSVTVGIRDWETPQTLNQTIVTNATQPAVVSGANGRAVAVWSQGNETLTSVIASIYVPGSGWSIPVTVSTNDNGLATAPQVAMDRDGNALVVWQQSAIDGDLTRTDIWSSTYSVTSDSWTQPLLLETNDIGNAVSPHVTMQSDGRAAVVWTQSDGTLISDNQQAINTVWANIYIPSIGWTDANQIDADAVLAVDNLSVTLNVFGEVIVVWSDTSNGQTYNIKFNRYLPGPGWDTPQNISSAINTGNISTTFTVSMAGSDTGRAVAVWNEYDGAANHIRASQFERDSGWQTPVTIDTNDAGNAFLPRVSIDAAGSNAAAVWQEFDGTHNRIAVNRFSADTGWGSAVIVDGNLNTDAIKPGIVISERSQVIATWLQSDGLNTNLWANVFDPENGWQTAQIIDTENKGAVSGPVLATDNTGDVFVVWQQFDGTVNNVWSNRFAIGNTGLPNIPPVIVTNGDQTVLEGDTVTLDASASFDQDGTIASYSWSQTSGSPIAVPDNSPGAIINFVAPTVLDGNTLVITVTATDDAGGVASKDVTITIKPPNNPPIANSGSLTVVQDTPANGVLTGTDSDGDPLSYAIASQGNLGAVNLTDTATGTFTYTPNAGESGTDSFTFTVNDGSVSSAVATVTVTITPLTGGNNAPIAQDSAITLNEDSYIVDQLPAYDPDGDPLSYIFKNGNDDKHIGNAYFIDPASGKYLYTAFNNKNGIGKITYKVNDGQQDSNFAVLTVTVLPVNDPPVANSGTLTATEGRSVQGVLTGTDIDNTTLTYSVARQPNLGTVTITNPSTGEYTYTGLLGFVGADTFEFSVNDGELSDTNTIAVNVLSLAGSTATNNEYAYYLMDRQEGYNVPLYTASLANANTIKAGDQTLTLDKYGTGTLNEQFIEPGGRISSPLPFALTRTSYSQKVVPLPLAFAGTDFIAPQFEGSFNIGSYTLYSPYVDAVVTIENNGNVSTLKLPKGRPVNTSSNSTLTSATFIKSDVPIMVGVNGLLSFGNYALPPASTELWGVLAEKAYVAVMEDNTHVTAYFSNGAQTSYTLSKGDVQLIDQGLADTSVNANGAGNAVRIVADKPVAGISVSSAGFGNYIPFIEKQYFAKRYALPVGATYVAVVCSEPGATVSFNNGGSTPETQTCNATNELPGKLVFGNYIDNYTTTVVSGAYIESDYPIHVIYQTPYDSKERNLFGDFLDGVVFEDEAPVISQMISQQNVEQDTVAVFISGADPDGKAVSYSAVGLPSGLNIDSQTGLISGVIASGTSGSYAVTVTVSDGVTSSDMTFSWEILPPG